MSIIKETKYLTFEATVPIGKKTNVVSITNNKSEREIGTISWWSTWRCYCFFPNKDTVWNIECMRDILFVINKLMEERRCAKKK